MTLDKYLSYLQGKFEELANNVIEKAPVLGIPYIHLETPEPYRNVRDHPVYSTEYAEWIAKKLNIKEEVVRDPVIRSAIYYILDTVMIRGSSMYNFVMNRIKSGQEISEDVLKSIAKREGVEIFPAFYWLDFIKSIRSAYEDLGKKQSSDQGQQ